MSSAMKMPRRNRPKFNDIIKSDQNNWTDWVNLDNILTVKLLAK